MNSHTPALQESAFKPLPTIEIGFYRHYKGGLYEVKALARHSEDLSAFVVYQAHYGEKGLWIRPADMFSENIIHEGVLQARFSYLGKTLD